MVECVMPLEAKAQAYVDRMAALAAAADPPRPPLDQIPPSVFRETLNRLLETLDGPAEPVAKIEDREIPGPGGLIPVRVYTPEGQGPCPVLVYFRGGGWVAGTPETHDGVCRALANAANCVVVAVSYRLAPENKFPAAVEDCYAATRWVAENASAINGDATRVAVGGDSVGGGLTAVVALMARDRGGPFLAYQLIVYPVTNYDLTTPSYLEEACNAPGMGNTRDTMIYFWRQYLNDEADGRNPYASPLRAEDLSGLPPALVITAQYDVLRDEGQAYAARLHDAGVLVTLSNYETSRHGFFSMGTLSDHTQAAREEVATALRSAFATREAAQPVAR
jgi:acetyl esterase